MLEKITTKALRAIGKPIYSIKYGVGTTAIAKMLGQVDYYHEGVNGWNYDVYDFGDYFIITGLKVPRKGIKSIPYYIADEWFNRSAYVHSKDGLIELWKEFENRIKLL